MAVRRPGIAFVGVMFLLAGAPVASGASEKGMVPLQTTLPRPAFSGTPAFIVSANLEKVTGKLREPYPVPEGTTNVAARCRVTASDPEPFVGNYAMVTDGGKEADGNSFVELNTGLQWVQVDLGRICRVVAILVWHYHGEARAYRDMVIRLGQGDGDGLRWQTVFNNDHDNSSGLGLGADKEYIDTFEGRLVPVDGLTARYVRLYSNGNTTDDMNDYIEVEVWGAPQ